MSRDLYGAHIAAGKAEGAYKRSLYDISDVGAGLEHKKALEGIKLQETSNIIGTLSSAVELGSTLYGGWMDKKKFEESKGHIQERLAEKKYKEQKGYSEMTPWDEISAEKKQSLMGEFTPKAEEQTKFERLFGEKPKWTFGEDMGDYFSRADIMAAGKYGETSKLDKLLGYNVGGFNIRDNDEEPYSTMHDEVNQVYGPQTAEQAGYDPSDTYSPFINPPVHPYKPPGSSAYGQRATGAGYSTGIGTTGNVKG